jgi:hypothetical protein
LLVEVEPLLVVRLDVSCVVYCVNWCDQLWGAAEFVLNKLLFGLLNTQASHILFKTSHRWAFVRAEYSSVIIGRINSLDFDGFAAEILKLERQLFFNGFGVFITLFLPNCLGKSFIGVLWGALGRVEAGDEAGDSAQENWTVGTLGGASGGCLVSPVAHTASWGARTDARFIEYCIRV